MDNKISERHQESIFKKLLSLPANKVCADCKNKGAAWVSLAFGVFVCINCSGEHRSLGMHITQVRSTKLDSWTKRDIMTMELVGNEVANLFYEHKGCFGGEGRSIIRSKYVGKVNCKENTKGPVEIVKQTNYQIKKKELLSIYRQETVERKEKRRKVVRKKFELSGKKRKHGEIKKDVITQGEVLDFLGVEETKDSSLTTDIEDKKEVELFDLDFCLEVKEDKPKGKEQITKAKTDDLFFIDFTENKPCVRKSQSSILNEKEEIKGYEFSSEIQKKKDNDFNDKYSVFDVYKIYNSSSYM